CFAALGTDTAGSIRIPASYCGVVGFKPTYGRASLRGVIPLSWTLDHIGPLCRTVEDAALVLGAIAGYDELDPATVDVPVPDDLRQIHLARREIRRTFAGVDLLITPTMMRTAETLAESKSFDPLGIRNTSPFALLGLPTISVPCGFSTSGLPIGLQISGAPFA